MTNFHDELGHIDRNIGHETERRRAIENGCEFISITPDEQNFNIFNAINKIHKNLQVVV